MSAPRAAGGSRVGIVVVSHSRALAEAAVGLAAEVVSGRPARTAVAAGLDESTFGTDAVRIAAAVEEVDDGDGVVVLMDVGSAVLSAELALELLPDDVRERVVLSPAPLVEGLLVASVVAAGGADRAEVAAEARAALLAKDTHLGTAPDGEPAPAADGRLTGSFVVANPHGLHARPAARLVGEVRRLDADVTVRNLTTGAGPVPAGSLSRVATLGALRGHEVEVAAAGPEAREAVDRVLALAARAFDEAPDPDGERPDPAPSAGPLPASPGIAIGPAVRLRAVPVPVDERPAGPPEHEERRLADALAAVRRDVRRTRDRTGPGQAGVFDAHLLLLDDAELTGAARAGTDAGTSAAGAWARAVTALEAQWAALPDPYLRARAADVRAVGDQVLRVLAGQAPVHDVDVDGVLVAEDLTPALAGALDPGRVLGVVLSGSSPTAHAVILVRALGIPAVVAAGPGLLDVPDGTPLVVDGTEGRVLVDPPAAVAEEYRTRRRELADRRARDAAEAPREAVTRDGRRVAVSANVGSVTDARAAAAAGADGVGLLRTEVLFLDRDRPPTAEEQEREYAAVLDALAGRPVTVRTLDVGGDKPLRYWPQAAEANPFLGVRGLRLSLTRPDLLRTQLAAVCRAARHGPVRLMVPMVTVVEEVLAVRRLLTEAAAPGPVPDGLRVGVMVEVPAVALNIEAFLPHVDFLSIGTNDLTQYTLAAERGSPALAALADPLDPAVLRLVGETASRAAGRVPVSVCGEAAADPAAVPVLVGLGVRELSVAPSAVPTVKAAVRRLDSGACAELARRCLAAAGAAEVRALVRAAVADGPGVRSRPAPDA
ncbi:phosphocarrier protein FPr [Geodermatophilus tzadiensis]|uniref:Phosphocarrier protein HPr n=1 Tax=Geodermatophilus tzadiensis TaxID=1137988 RepID=A0A2T0T8S1_9ACTN|nr:phosphoenolpyruvate--protein phosphotransferase [Geodermatophilus tzadiensis]PRY42065.1 phosphocarrier protein FPr [Geodermatophilus tzadiensis]